MLPDPVPVVLPVLAGVVLPVASEVEPVEPTLLTVLADEPLGELPAVSEVELPVSCTPNARAAKPMLPPPPASPAEGAVGEVRLLLCTLLCVWLNVMSAVLVCPAPK